MYLGSNGKFDVARPLRSSLRRRLSNGLAATLQYTYSKAVDDASALAATSLGTVGSAPTAGTGTNQPTGSTIFAPISTAAPTAPSIAQNWLNLGAERGPSTFDQRHLLSLQMQYTSGEGLRGGALLSGWRGTVLKEWTFTPTLLVGTGFPETPIYLTNVVGTGITGTIRPNYTGASITAAPAGLFLNPAAYSAPLPGQWGDAGRDSITGPTEVFLNASIGRTFRLSSSAECRLADGRNQRAEYRDLYLVQYDCHEPAIRIAQSGEYDAQAAD